MNHLEVAREFLLGEVRDRAQEMDSDSAVLGWALDGLAKRGLLALRGPIEFGGPDLAEEPFREFQELCARASGALAFLQTQHQSAASLIAKLGSPELKEKTLPGMADGKVKIGIGFSQLRRPGPPVLRATPEGSGWRIDGHIPWSTGFGFFEQVLIGATLPSGESLFGLIPFEDQEGLTWSPQMKLAAMESARTVTADLNGYHLQEAAFFRPEGWIHRNDQINITLQGWFALGCARAGLDVLESVAERRGGYLVEAFQQLDQELRDCRIKLLDQTAPEEERLAARAWGIELAARCGHAAVTASSGAAISLSHRAQRIYREAMVFTVSAQTGPIQEATLRRLVRPNPVESAL